MKVNKKTLQSESTKAKLLTAIATILSDEGFRALKVEHISKVSGVDKKLIYFHFGDLQGLFDHFLNSPHFSYADHSFLPSAANGHESLSELLKQHIRMIRSDKLLSQLLLWELAENKKSLQNLGKERNNSIEQLLSDIAKKGYEKLDIEPLLALILGGIYYMNIHAATQGVPFYGIDLRKEEDVKRIMTVLAQLYKS